MPTRFIIIIMFLTALFFGFFLVWPEYQDFQQSQTEVKQKEAVLKSITARYSKINEINEKLEEYSDVLAGIEASLKNYSVPVLFNYLHQTAGESGLLLQDLVFEGAGGEGLKETNINLQVSGSYSSLESFLYALENSAKFFKIKSINFSSPDKESDFSFNLGIATYSY